MNINRRQFAEKFGSMFATIPFFPYFKNIPSDEVPKILNTDSLINRKMLGRKDLRIILRKMN